MELVMMRKVMDRQDKEIAELKDVVRAKNNIIIALQTTVEKLESNIVIEKHKHKESYREGLSQSVRY